IPNSEFGHGRTRNLAAQLATGEFVVYLTHDAIPASESWLTELLAPFAIDERIVAVMGKQIPRPGCFPLLKYEIRGVFAGFGPDFGTTVFYKDDFAKDEGVLGAMAFYSDVNSAARRSFLTDVVPYRDVRYAED
ncbi:glycosyltransferase family A protein, partial [Vibrio cidicii]|uniref:glycosyltransferase family A protein n=1 Tax=Vibrio cidicii TaxID=1763883 RepID=UPI0037043221